MKHKKLLMTVAGIFIVADIALAAGAIYVTGYEDKWYPDTVVNGIDVSGKTYEETTKEIADCMSDYSITIKGRENATLTIKGSDIGLTLKDDSEIARIFDEEHENRFDLKKFSNPSNFDVKLDVKYDAGKLEQLISESQMVAGSDTYKLHEPVNAYVKVDDDGKAVIVPEEDGNVVLEEKLLKYLDEQIRELSSEMDIDDTQKFEGIYRVPQYTSTSDKLQEQCEKYNACLYQWLTWDMGSGVTETITPDDIKGWISLSKKGKVVLDKDAMSDWIENFCLKYKTMGATRKFTTHDGKVIDVKGGDYGWRIDYEATVDAAYEQLTCDKDYSLVQAYFDNPSDENKEALTTVWEPNYSNKAFKMDYDNPTNDWDTKNYSEIDLSEQKVYVYKDGKLAHECICVTGLISDPKRATRTGCYYIKEKKTSYVLTGENYSTPTKFWIRIMWTGTGYHYMNRRDWKHWTKDIYKTRGSHGCINLQYDDAKALYDLITFYDAVFIHE